MTETLHAETIDCGLTVTATHSTPGALRLHYSVQNLSSLPLYLCNLLWRDVKINAATQQEEFEIQPNLAYIRATNDSVSVGMTVIDFPISDGIKIFHIPCLTRLVPNEVYEAQVELLLPLVPYRPVASAFQPKPLTDHRLIFELGFFSGTSEVEAHISQVNTTEGFAYTIESFLSKSQIIVSVGPFQTPVAVDTANKERVLWD